MAGYQQKHYLWGFFRATQGSSSRQLASNGIQSVGRQTTENVLAIRDETNVVNDRTPTEVDTQVVTDVSRRRKRIKKSARLDDYEIKLCDGKRFTIFKRFRILVLLALGDFSIVNEYKHVFFLQ